jgi:hypothetical protein
MNLLEAENLNAENMSVKSNLLLELDGSKNLAKFEHF